MGAPSVDHMFDLINGLPVHPLVVHAVVVLLPLATLGTIALVVRPSWRRPYGPLLVACAAVATVLIPVATSSGEALEKHVGDPGEHAELGDQLLWFALPMLVLLAALVWMDRRATVGADAHAHHRLAPVADRHAQGGGRARPGGGTGDLGAGLPRGRLRCAGRVGRPGLVEVTSCGPLPGP